MTQRVPSAGFYDNIVEDHTYTMFSMYPPNFNQSDPWQLTKEEKAMVREILLTNVYIDFVCYPLRQSYRVLNSQNV